MRQTLLDQLAQFKTVAALSVGIAASAIALNHWGFFNLIEWAIRDQWVRSRCPQLSRTLPPSYRLKRAFHFVGDRAL